MKSFLQFIAATALSCSGAMCQTSSVTLAGQGYRTPQTAVDAAPGQVMVLHLYGLGVTSPDRITALPDAAGELPRVLNGISVDLVQGDPPKIIKLPLRALYQACTQSVARGCVPLTGITLQLPFDLETQPSGIPALRITDNGKSVGGVLLRPVADNVHVLNTCDDTQVFISASYSVPQNVCTAVVMVNSKLNSLHNLARGGDQLAMWVYGLGAKTEQSTPCCDSPEQLSKPVQQFTLNFDYRVNAPASRALPGFGQTANPAFTAYVGGGTYQVNFALPPAPDGLVACDGVTVKSNLTVTITGAN